MIMQSLHIHDFLEILKIIMNKRTMVATPSNTQGCQMIVTGMADGYGKHAQFLFA